MNDVTEISKRLHAVVFGRVQGVNFRAHTARTARQLGLRGWVRNLLDGSVEAVAEGDGDDLRSFLDALNTGSSGSSVERVEASWEEASGEFESFEIRYFPF